MKDFWSKAAEIDVVVKERGQFEHQFQQKKSQAEKMAHEISSLIPDEIKNSSLNLLQKYLPDYFGVNVEQCDVNFSVLPGYFHGIVFIKVFMKTKESYDGHDQMKANKLNSLIRQELEKQVPGTKFSQYDVGFFMLGKGNYFENRLDGLCC